MTAPVPTANQTEVDEEEGARVKTVSKEPTALCIVPSTNIREADYYRSYSPRPGDLQHLSRRPYPDSLYFPPPPVDTLRTDDGAAEPGAELSSSVSSLSPEEDTTQHGIAPDTPSKRYYRPGAQIHVAYVEETRDSENDSGNEKLPAKQPAHARKKENKLEWSPPPLRMEKLPPLSEQRNESGQMRLKRVTTM